MNNNISVRATRRGWGVSVFLLVLTLPLILLAASAVGARESDLPPWQEPRLIKNIAGKTDSSATYALAEMNGYLFFLANNQGIERNYSELWRTDGTPGGTIMLERRDDTTFSPLFVLGDELLFLAPHPDYGNELWISDGTPGNAHVMGDAFPGPFDGYVADHTVAGDYLYFTAYDDVNLTELWRTDGTMAGTIRLTGPDLGLDVGTPGAFIDFNGALIFRGQTPENKPLLMKSNGTVAGTEVIEEMPDTFGGEQHVAGGLLYVLGREIWRSDGTAAGTYPIYTFPEDRGLVIEGEGAIAADSKVYFVTQDNSYNFELWQTLGTAATTTKISDLPGYYGRMATVGDRLFFVGTDQTHGNEPWTSDGTFNGTFMVKDIRPGNLGSNIDKIVAAGAYAFFAADTDTQYGQLWRSDGTTTGTVPVPTPGASAEGPMAMGLAPFGDELFFEAGDETHGREPWLTTGNGASAAFLKDINVIDSLSSMPGGFNYANNTLFFWTTAGLWKSDGSEAGTSLLVENILQQREVLAYPTGISANRLYFLINDYPTSTVELWRTDGTPTGTVLVKGIGEMYRQDMVMSMTDVNGTLYFARDNRRELWRSDGTSAGTLHIATPHPLTYESARIDQLTAVGNNVFFVATDGTHGLELWRSDGTTGGTAMVMDILPGAAGSDPTDPVALGSHVYFFAEDGQYGRELWRSDGTAAGTHLVKDVKPGAASAPTELTVFNNALYFAADDGTHGRELWRSDGTAAGTVMVKDTATDGGSAPRELTPGDDWLFFLAGDETGLQPWKSNGTAAGTGRITVVAYQDFYYPQGLAAVGNILFFSVGTNSSTGFFYQSDGTAAGTILLSEAFPDFQAYDAGNLTPAPGRLFFSAAHSFYGNEPFIKVVDLTRQTPTQLLLAEGAGFAYYQLRLSFRPAAPVTIRFAADDPTVEISPTSLVIQPDNWNTPVTVGVRAAFDGVGGTREATISQTLESADATVNGAVTTLPVSIGWRFVFAPVVRR